MNVNIFLLDLQQMQGFFSWEMTVHINFAKRLIKGASVHHFEV